MLRWDLGSFMLFLWALALREGLACERERLLETGPFGSPQVDDKCLWAGIAG